MLENIAENINWLITALTFLGGLYMYVNHTHRLNKQQDQLNKQQVLINAYQLKKSEEEELEKRQASIEANVYKTTNRNGNPAWKMKIYNKGKAKAYNVDFNSESLDADEAIILIRDPNMFPIPSLLPSSSLEVSVILCYGHKPSHNITFTWDDDSEEKRSQEQNVIFQ